MTGVLLHGTPLIFTSFHPTCTQPVCWLRSPLCPKLLCLRVRVRAAEDCKYEWWNLEGWVGMSASTRPTSLYFHSLNKPIRGITAKKAPVIKAPLLCADFQQGGLS